MEDGVGELRGLLEECGGLCGFGRAEPLHLADDIKQLGRRQRLKSPANGIRRLQSILQGRALGQRWKRVGAVGLPARRHTHIKWRWLLRILILLLLVIPVPGAASVVVAVVDPQRPSHNLMLVQVAHGGRRFIDVGVFQKAEAFWSAGLFVVDEAEVDDGASSCEEFAYLFFTDAWRVLACRAYSLR